MRSLGLVVAKVLAKDPAQAAPIEHYDVIRKIPANGVHHAFGE
jgi:hypothetical protein